MNGIQSFVGGGGAFGQDVRSQMSKVTGLNQRKKDREDLNKDRTGGRGDKSSKEQFEDLQQSNRDRAKNFNFTEDLKKLIGPSGSGTFLFTGNPQAEAFRKKYGLSVNDLIKLRLGATQRGFQGNIRDVGGEALERFGGGIFNLGPQAFGFNAQNVISQFKEGMTPFDRLPSNRGGLTGFVEDSLGAGPFSALADKLSGGSPMGSAGLAYGRSLGLEGDRLNQFASVIANDRDLYNQMGLMNFMKQREIDQLSYDTQRGLPTRGGNRTPEPTPDPITAAYNPSMNPFLNQGIQPFSYMV